MVTQNFMQNVQIWLMKCKRLIKFLAYIHSTISDSLQVRGRGHVDRFETHNCMYNVNGFTLMKNFM